MSNPNKTLNAVANLLIDNGIEVKNTVEDKQAIITLSLLTMTNADVPMDVAFDTLMGAGAFKQFAGDLYDELNAQAAE